MKKLNIGISAALPILMLFFACKKTPNEAPKADTELQTSIDASFAAFMVSDVEMIASVMGEDDSGSRAKFYEPSATSQGTTTVIRNLATKRLSYTFNNTTCRDGHVRDGAIFMFFGEVVYAPTHTLTGNENYCRDYNFAGRITLEEYKVDDWLVDNKDFENSNPNTNNSLVLLTNLRTNPTKVTGNLQWSFEGGFTMKKNLDSMAWKGKWTKTLENTGDAKVFAISTQSAIQWPLAVVSYTGEAKGLTPGNVSYSAKYYQKLPLKREFTCYPDVVSSATTAPAPTNSLVTYKLESHPFVSGVVSFTTGTAYPREIYFDNQQTTYGGVDSPVLLPAQCDNKGVVQIKGNFYPIDLRK